MGDELGKLTQECLLRKLDGFLEASDHPCPLLFIECRTELQQIVRGLDAGEVPVDLEQAFQGRRIIRCVVKLAEAPAGSILQLGIVGIQLGNCLVECTTQIEELLVEAFKATLEEVRTADLLLHVVDASSPLAAERMEIVDRVLEEIGAGAAPRIIVMNKADLLEFPPRVTNSFETVAISALKGEGLDRLLDAIARSFANLREEVSVTLAASRGDLIAMARRDGEVLSEEYHDGVVAMRARVSVPVAGRLRKAAVATA